MVGSRDTSVVGKILDNQSNKSDEMIKLELKLEECQQIIDLNLNRDRSSSVISNMSDGDFENKYFTGKRPSFKRKKISEDDLEKIKKEVSNSDDAICLMKNGKIIYVNEAWLREWGYEKNDVIGCNFNFIQGKKTDRKKIDRILEKSRQRIKFTEDILNYKKDGTCVNNHIVSEPFLDDCYKVTSFLTIPSFEEENSKIDDEIMKINQSTENSETMNLSKIRNAYAKKLSEDKQKTKRIKSELPNPTNLEKKTNQKTSSSKWNNSLPILRESSNEEKVSHELINPESEEETGFIFKNNLYSIFIRGPINKIIVKKISSCKKIVRLPTNNEEDIIVL